ncbi:MAG: ribosomal protein [Dehalococcoidia bacterium]|nr:ribosomal protein [Dehalococcoidia bacterium]
MVVKNTLAGIAADRTGKGALRGVLRGPTGLAFGYGEPAGPAKTLADFIRTSRVNLSISGAVLEGTALNGEEVQRLATLPPRPVLISQLMGNILAPLSGLVYALNYHIGGLARVLEGRRKQLEQSGS